MSLAYADDLALSTNGGKMNIDDFMYKKIFRQGEINST